MKRGREQNPEEEPLTKRINNLHLDGSALLSNAASSSSNFVAPNTSQHTASDINGTSHQNGGNHFTNDDISTNGHDLAATGITKEMIENREMPESLNIYYPQSNTSNNSQYFEYNKVLHNLHIDRLRRLGKITENGN